MPPSSREEASARRPQRSGGSSAPDVSVAEGHGAVAGELHQRRGAFELGVLHEVSLVEGALVEADRAHVEPAALLDELVVYALDRRLLAFADRVDIAAQREPDALA